MVPSHDLHRAKAEANALTELGREVLVDALFFVV